MNKRIKKKRALENSLRMAEGAIEFLFDQNNQLWRIVEKMEEINSKNVKATNNRFDKLEKELEQVKAENKQLRQELKSKRSWFGRK